MSSSNATLHMTPITSPQIGSPSSPGAGAGSSSRVESLEDYYRAKQYAFDAVHEISRAKDVIIARSLACHETHSTVVSQKVGRLVAEVEDATQKAAKTESSMLEYQAHIDKLNRVMHHHQSEHHQQGQGSELHHELVKLHGPRDATSAPSGHPAPPPAAVAAELLTASQAKDVTIQMQHVEITTLREALQILVRKAEATLHLKAEKAVEDLLSEANQNILRSKLVANDKFLSQMIEDKKVQLLAMRSAQHEIDQLKSERAATMKSLRKAEQEVVQMRLKMMERDSSMIVVSKRVKEVEGQLEEETSTSAARIEAAERLAGDLTFKYESELRRMRDIIDEHMRRNSDMMKTVEFHKKQVERAEAEVEAERQRGIDAVIETERQQKAECKVKVDEVTRQLLDANAKKDMLTRQIASLEFQAKETHQTIQSLKETLEQANSDNENLKEERASLLGAMAERNKGPLAFLQAKMGMAAGKDSNTIVDVSKLVGTAIEDSSSQSPLDRKTSLAKLASRFIRISDFKDKSEKAEHPTISGQVSDALQQLAAGMIMLSDGSPSKKSEADGGSAGSPLSKLKNKAKGVAALSPSKLREPKSGGEKDEGAAADEGSTVSAKKSSAKSGKNGAPATPTTTTLASTKAQVRDSGTGGEKGGAVLSSPRSTLAASNDNNNASDATPRGELQPSALAQAAEQRRKYDVADEVDYSPASEDQVDGRGDDSDDEIERIPPTPTLSDLEDEAEPDLYIRPKMADAESQCFTAQFQERAVQVSMDGGGKKGGMPGGSNNPSRAGSRHSVGSDNSNSVRATPAPSPSGKTIGGKPPIGGPGKAMPPAVGPRKSTVMFDHRQSNASSRRPVPIDDRDLTADGALEGFEAISRLIMEKNEMYLRAVIEGRLRTLTIEHATKSLETDLDISLQQVLRVLPESPMEHIGAALKERCVMQNVERTTAHIFLSPSAATVQLPTAPATQSFEAATPLNPEDVVTYEAYNDLVGRFEKLRACYQETIFVHELHSAMYESMRRELAARKEMESMTAAESMIGRSGASPLFLVDPRRMSASNNSSPREKNQIVHVSSDEAVTAWMESISIFLFESQKYIKKEFLPNQKPLMYEGRSVVNVDHAQELLGRLLDAMKLQRDQMIAEKKERKKKKKERKSKQAAADGVAVSEPPSTCDRDDDDVDTDFLQTPQAEPQEPVTPTAEGEEEEAEDGDNIDSALLERIKSTPRARGKGKGAAKKASSRVDSDDDDDDEDDVTPRQRPVIPKLHFPVDHNLERLAVDAVLQPLMGALKKKLASIGLEKLLDAEQRQGLAIELERGLDDPIAEGSGTTAADVILGLLTGTRVKALQAILSLETSLFTVRDFHLQLLSQVFTSFPKQLVQRVPEDFDPELAYELVVRVAKWWDQWFKTVGAVQEDINKGKQDRINRMIDLCEMVDASETAVQTAYWSLVALAGDGGVDGHGHVLTSPLAGAVPKREVVDLLHARGRRHNEDLLQRLEHPAPAEFSLQHRTKVQTHPTTALSATDPLTRANGGGFAKALRMKREAPEVDRVTSPASNMAVAALLTPAVVPAVALLASSSPGGAATKWNPNAKKLGRELPATTPPKRLPPL